MMKNLFKLSLVLMIGTVLITACGKYEEGPGFSLLPKKTRLTGTYMVDKYVDSNGNEQNSNDDNEYIIEKDGTYKIKDGSSTTEGTWEFRNDKQDLYVEYTIEVLGVSYTVEATNEIIRLTNKELWLQDDNGNQTHMVKQ